MNKVMIGLVCMFLCVSMYAVNAQSDVNDLVGNWTYTSTDLPYGYDKGEVIIKEVDGKLSADVNFNGMTQKLGELKKSGDTYTCSAYIDGADLNLTMKKEGDSLSVSVGVQGHVIPVTLVRAQ